MYSTSQVQYYTSPFSLCFYTFYPSLRFRDGETPFSRLSIPLYIVKGKIIMCLLSVGTPLLSVEARLPKGGAAADCGREELARSGSKNSSLRSLNHPLKPVTASFAQWHVAALRAYTCERGVAGCKDVKSKIRPLAGPTRWVSISRR